MHWSTLRSLGNSRAVQFSAIFPAIGYFILFNDEVARFLGMAALDRSPNHGGLLEHLWGLKLFFLYFGLMSLGLGSALYQFKCPYIIKKHGDWMDYVRLDGDSLSGRAAADLAQTVGIPYSDTESEMSQDEAIMRSMQLTIVLQPCGRGNCGKSTHRSLCGSEVGVGQPGFMLVWPQSSCIR